MGGKNGPGSIETEWKIVIRLESIRKSGRWIMEGGRGKKWCGRGMDGGGWGRGVKTD